MKGEFIGRTEASIAKGSGKLKIFNFHKEKTTKITPEYKKSFKLLIDRWQSMVGAQEVEFDTTLSL